MKGDKTYKTITKILEKDEEENNSAMRENQETIRGKYKQAIRTDLA